MRRRVLLLLGCVAALGCGAPVASAADLYVPDDGALPVRPLAAPLRDTGPARGAAVARAAASGTATYFAQDGQPIRVDVSDSLRGATREAVQGYVDFLGSRVHGSELRRLTVYILTAAEVRAACSETSLACYIPARELMIIPGEQTPQGEVPLEYVITHEYGHHIAANRTNDPWPAIAWGPKAWATYEEVCAGVYDHRYFPGDQGSHYTRDPGENWAEAYAQLQYPDRYRWQFTSSLEPDDGAFAAIVRDVVKPWRRNTVVRRSGRLDASRRSQTFRVTTRLDGRVVLSLRASRRTSYDLQILSGGRVATQSRSRGSQDRLVATDCSVRSFAVRVVRRSGSGPFSVRIQTAG